MARWVVPSCDREANLVVKLGRRRDVAFLLDVESHAGGPDQDAATLRSERLGDNCLVGTSPCADCCECFGSSGLELVDDLPLLPRDGLLAAGCRNQLLDIWNAMVLTQ